MKIGDLDFVIFIFNYFLLYIFNIYMHEYGEHMKYRL